MPTMDTRAHLWPLLAVVGSIQRIELHVISRAWSNTLPSVVPSSPPRSRRLCARSAAAHSTTPLREPRSYPIRASFAK
eukprot:800607-Pleurochrysis_carterae.AAC.1